jgi:hypothetical protein
MTRRLIFDAKALRERAAPEECYVCGQAKINGLNWTTDPHGNARCPRHEVGVDRFVTLGDLVAAKRSRP